MTSRGHPIRIRLPAVLRGRRFALAIAAVASLIAPPASAQVVRGVASERGTGTPLAGVVVSIVDEQGRVVEEALSDENGVFEIRLPAAGTYSLDAKRIGVRRVRVPAFAIAAGETRQQRITLEPVPTVLGELRITGRSDCYRRPEDNARTAALWEEARAALRATVLTRRDSSGTDSVVRFLRKLDVYTWRVLFEHRWRVPVATERPFRSLPAEDLSQNGYVRVNADGSADYFAPDAEVLLSDTFLGDHCFRVQPGTLSREGQVGLVFEPVRRRTTPDVKGVLWLDRKTAHLRTLEYTYTWLPHDERPGDFGGTVSFFRTPAGRWIVRSWRIRTPEFGHERYVENTIGQRIRLADSRTPHVVRIMEEGGAVPVGVLLSEMGTVHGAVVLDSLGNRVLQGATVALGGTSDSAVTDANGRFVLPFIGPGSYTVVLRHPVLDSLGLEHLATTVDVTAGEAAAVLVRFPSAPELADRLCSAAVHPQVDAVIRFLVVDHATGEPLRDVPIVLTRTVPRPLSDEAAADSAARTAARLDAQGSYVVCSVPGGQVVRLESAPGAPDEWSATVRAQPGEVGWSVVRVRRKGR